MSTQIDYAGKPISLQLSQSAQQQLASLNAVMCVEMELYFSCLIRKRLRFSEACNTDNSVKINDKLYVRLHPVMTKACSMDDSGSEPPLTDFPIKKLTAYVPKWLNIDYRSGQWCGEFGYD